MRPKEFAFSVPLVRREKFLLGNEAWNRTARSWRTNISSITCYGDRIVFSLLLLGGDVETNPGDKCGICLKRVKSNQTRIRCGECEICYHAECCNFELAMHDLINTSLCWICPQCGLPNFSGSFFNESIDSLASLNSFASLDETTTNHVALSQNNEMHHHKGRYKQPERKAPKRKLTCLVVNCQSIRNKVADIAAIAEEYNPDIILGNESWLHSGITNNEVFPDNYNIYRKDRLSDSHGGVFQAVKKDIIVTHRDDLDTDCEIIWTQCQIKNRRSKSLFFASFYRPNANDLNSLNELDASYSN